MSCGALVVTTGTFLNGLIHIGTRAAAGRTGRRAAVAPAGRVAEGLGLPLGPAQDRHAAAAAQGIIDFDGARGARRIHRAARRRSDRAVLLPDGRRSSASRCSCYQLYTTPARARARPRRTSPGRPLFNGQIQGIGPRYCPSIEDKVIRFADKERHQLFLEPEGLDVDEIYVNGFSMSLPADVQLEMVRALPGLARAEMLRPLTPSNTTSCSRPSCGQRSRPSECAACSWPGRSTERPATRKRPARDLWPGVNAALARPGQAGVRARPRRGLHRRHGGRPGDEGLPRALPDVHLARGAPARAADRQRRPPADAKGPARSARWTTSRWERFVARREQARAEPFAAGGDHGAVPGHRGADDGRAAAASSRRCGCRS